MPVLRLWFDHGLGDCVQFAALMQLYKRRGWDISVHHEENKEPIWRAAGLPFIELDDTAYYHDWTYPAGFNTPGSLPDGAGSKLFGNLNRAPLPSLGEPMDLWEELCDIELDGEPLATSDLLAETDRFLADLPEPIVLVHTRGSNFADEKSLPDDTARELYRQLLDGMDGSLVLLDWDQRVPKLPSARVRHLKDDWGHISLDRLYCLMKRAHLLIGIDSGPFHFAKFSKIPALGVFHQFYPSCVCLPRPESVHMTRSSPEYRAANIPRRRRWNIVEYAGDMPTAQEIASHALRMLRGPRYVRDPRRIGRDVQLQQWIHDWCRGATSTSWLADRSHTFDFLLRETSRRFPSPTIVETGCIRGGEDWGGGGYSTYLFGAYLDGLDAGQLISVDITNRSCAFAREATQLWQSRVRVEQSDSVAWLRDNSLSIDVLYLDSMDVEVPEHTEHGLAEIKAALPSLHANSLVVFDDTVWNKGWRGKGTLAIPHLLEQGWKVIAAGYQVVLSR